MITLEISARSFRSDSLFTSINAVTFLDRTIFIALENRVVAILKRLKGEVPFMTSSNINTILIKAPWKIIEELTTEFESKEVEHRRGPLCFSGGAVEWVEVAIPLASGGIGAIVSILVAKMQQNKRVKVTFNDHGNITSIDAPTKEQAIEICNELKSIKEIKIEQK